VPANRFLFSSSFEETIEIGCLIRGDLKPGSIVAIQGDLGAGKTTLVKGLASNWETPLVNSPTFSYLHFYPGLPPLFHFDLYRLKGSQEFIQLGFTDYFDLGGICCIEWPDRIASLLPTNTLYITLEHMGETKRKISL
jgi:tRNA threonylcarbamoyladenosine biosynthesis protein TsaE